MPRRIEQSIGALITQYRRLSPTARRALWVDARRCRAAPWSTSDPARRATASRAAESAPRSLAESATSLT